MKKNLVRTAFSISILIILSQPAYPQWLQTNWEESNSFFDLYSNQDVVFARTWDSLNGGRMFLTANNGSSWYQIGSADDGIDILSIVMWDDNILAGTWNGFYESILSDPNWYAATTAGIPEDTPIWSAVRIDNDLFAGTVGDIYKSSIDNTNSWTESGIGIPVEARITSIAANNNAIFAGSDSDGVFISTNGGTNWTAINSGLTDTHISQLASIGTKMFAVTVKDGVFVSDANDMSWVSDPNITNWKANNSGLKNINCLLPVNDLLFAGTDSNGVYLSNNSGLTWISVNSGLPDNTRIWSMETSDNNVFAGTSEGIWRINPEDINSYTITANASEGGTIQPEGEITVYKTDSRTFTIVPELGYRISDVLVDGSSEGAIDSYTFSNVTENHTISAVFVAVPIYTITSSAETGGTISPLGTVMVSEGSSQTYTITPLQGYAIYSVLVDGNSVGTDSTYKFTDISEDHTISVTFKVAPYIITTSVYGGGSISPSGKVDVWAGESQTFNITPSSGYEISNILVDGIPVGAVTSYTFSSVNSNHTIIATFSSLTKYQINCGGADSPPYSADQYYNSGSTYSVTNTIDMNNVTNPATENVYQSERYGTVTYTLPNLISGASYKVRLHFSENYWTSRGSRRFNVTINGATVLANYDIFAQTGAQYKAVVNEYATIANASGEIIIVFTTITDNAKIGGIEIIKQ